jgi:hypothetical protein
VESAAKGARTRSIYHLGCLWTRWSYIRISQNPDTDSDVRNRVGDRRRCKGRRPALGVSGGRLGSALRFSVNHPVPLLTEAAYLKTITTFERERWASCDRHLSNELGWPRARSGSSCAEGSSAPGRSSSKRRTTESARASCPTPAVGIPVRRTSGCVARRGTAAEPARTIASASAERRQRRRRDSADAFGGWNPPRPQRTVTTARKTCSGGCGSKKMSSGCWPNFNHTLVDFRPLVH